MKNTKIFGSNAIALAALLLGTSLVAPPTLAKPHASYKPGISLVPEVFRPDGVTDETYATGQGLSLWTTDRAIPKGDKIQLNVFAATGGGELREIKIRLDNVLVGDIAKAPWHTTLDTATLGVGFHMVEVWAVATGDSPQSTTQTLTFKVDPAVRVKGSQQFQGPNGQVGETALPGATPGAEPETFSDAAPQTPDYLKSQAADAAATVTITARSAASTEQAGGTTVGDTPVTINEPTLFIVQPSPGSTATRFAYAIVRSNGATVSSAPQPLRVAYDRIRIERLSDTQSGLRSGKVTLWVWGLDKQGDYSNPIKTYLDIPSDR